MKLILSPHGFLEWQFGRHYPKTAAHDLSERDQSIRDLAFEQASHKDVEFRKFISDQTRDKTLEECASACDARASELWDKGQPYASGAMKGLASKFREQKLKP